MIRDIEYQGNNWAPTVEGGNPLAMMACGREIILSHTMARNTPRPLQWGKTILPEVTKTGAVFLNHANRALVLTYTLCGETSRAMETCQTVESFDSKYATAGSRLEDPASLGFLYFRLGDCDKAQQVLDEALSGQQDKHNTVATNACSLALGNLNLELGDYPKAEELLLKSLEICQKGGNVVFELWVLPVLAQLHLKMGQPEKAAEYVDRGFELLKPDSKWYGLPAPMYLTKGVLDTARQDYSSQ